MDFRPIFHVHGILLLLLAVSMTLPLLVDLALNDPDWLVFAESIFITAFAGGILMLANRGGVKHMSIRQAFLFTTTAYLIVGVFGALPFYLGSTKLSFADAFFETCSGLSTTGSTVMVGLDSMPRGILLWRSLLQELGGVGIVVLALAILPTLKVGGMQLFRTESSDTMEKMLPRTTHIALTTFIIFNILVVICAICLWLAGMTPFDAINHAIPVISTGGFSTHDTSIAFFNSPLIEWICIIFMFSGAVPLMLYFQMVHGRPFALFQHSQVRWLAAVIALSTLMLTVWLQTQTDDSWYHSFRHSLFNVTSVISTTGLVSADYNQWGAFAIGLFFIITSIGGCTGSTAGGIKIFRFQILYEIAKVQLHRLMHPHGVFIPRYNGQVINEEVAASVMSFVILFGVSFCIIALSLTAFGLDLVTAMSSAAQALSNVGPGLGHIVGPAGNFSTLPEGAKWILSFAMILGRLELFTALIILTPAFWRQ